MQWYNLLGCMCCIYTFLFSERISVTFIMNWLVLSAILLHKSNKKKRTFKQRISFERRRLCDRRIPRHSLSEPKKSVFTVMFESGEDHSLVTYCGLNHYGFSELLKLFEPVYNSFTPYSSEGRIRPLNPNSSRGRKRSMNALQCLGLCLAWTRSRGSINSLCMIFGITNSVCSLFLRFGRRILVRFLANDTRSEIKMPYIAEIEEFKKAIEKKHNLLKAR